MVLHLFICLTCLASNYRASLVQVGLLNFTRYYSLAFNLDLPNARFQLTHAEPTDDELAETEATEELLASEDHAVDEVETEKTLH